MDVVDFFNMRVFLLSHKVETHLSSHLKRWAQVAEAFKGCVGANVAVFFEDGEAVYVFDGDDRVVETAVIPRKRRPPAGLLESARIWRSLLAGSSDVPSDRLAGNRVPSVVTRVSVRRGGSPDPRP